MKHFIIVSIKSLLNELISLGFSNGFRCCRDCFTLQREGSGPMTGTSAVCSYLAGLGTPGGNGSSESCLQYCCPEDCEKGGCFGVVWRGFFGSRVGATGLAPVRSF